MYIVLYLLISDFVHISVVDSHTTPSPSNSVEKAGQISNSGPGDTEMRRGLRYVVVDLSEPQSF
jgi:hypothetical protein